MDSQTVCIQNLMLVKAVPISKTYQTYRNFQISRKKKKTNKAGLYNLLALLINETLTPNSFDKVSNSDADTLKFLIKVVKMVNLQLNCTASSQNGYEYLMQGLAMSQSDFQKTYQKRIRQNNREAAKRVLKAHYA